ncbi:MAG: DNA repair protein RadC [Bacteroidales bacterium]|nr:DNA repair protein RadC [Bacteroidales bacterium]
MKPNNIQSIKNWATEDRPREKMLEKGREALSDAELIAILIGSGNNNETAVDLSRRILKDADDNLINLSQMSINELTSYNGIGIAKAVSVVAALELGRRRRFAEAAQQPKISNSKDAFEHFYMHMSDLEHEQFWIMLLNPANKVIKVTRISVGGVNGTTADPKRIFKIAIDNQATAIMLCHNHPSGKVEPSNADKALTRNIVNGGKLLEIKILDHIIVGINNYFSFADSGII